MSQNLERKKNQVADLKQRWSECQAMVVAENQGLTVPQTTQLRVTARAAGVYVEVVKNTLARRAVMDTPFALMADRLSGPLMYGVSKDSVKLAKVISDFSKDNEKLVIRGGALGGRFLESAQIKSLASLPSREVLLAQLAGVLQAPVATLARTLQEVPARFARTLAAVQQQKEAQA